MACNFKFYPVEKTYTDPVTAVFRPAIPYGRKYFKGDIVLMHQGMIGSKIFLNSHILREALLSSANYLERVLEIKITDVAKSEEVKEEVKPKRRTNIPKVEKVEETIIEEPTTVEETKEESTIETLGEEDLIVE